MRDRAARLVAWADRAMPVLGAGAVATLVLAVWVGAHTLAGGEPGEAEAQLRADSAVLACELVLTRAAIDTLAAWLAERNAQLAEACRMLPFGTPDECRDVVDARARQRMVP